MKFSTFLIFLLALSCGQSESKENVKSETRFRIDANGEKSMEYYAEYLADGRLEFVRDYKNGEIYMCHWRTYDDDQNTARNCVFKCL